MVKSS